MKKTSTLVRSAFAVIGIILISLTASAQEWDHVQPMDTLPHESMSGGLWYIKDSILPYSQIIPDPMDPSNNVLSINDYSMNFPQRGTFRYPWRLSTDFEVPMEQRNEFVGITVVFRAKPTAQSIAYEGNTVWWFIAVRCAGAISYDFEIQMKKDSLELIGLSDDFLGQGESLYHQMLGDTLWHTFRVTTLGQDVNIYVDEDPTPVISGKTYGRDPGAEHLRVGKQNRTAPYGGLFDYFLILEGAVYAPGEGPAIPEGIIVGPGTGVGISPTGVSDGLSVYPNPADEVMTLSFQQDVDGVAAVDIYSITGQKLMSPYHQYIPAGNREIRINTTSLSAGVYLLSVNGEFIKFVKR